MPLARIALAVLLAGLTRPALAQPATPASPGADDAWIATARDDLSSLYTHLHANPELSNQEVKTGERIADELEKAGAKVTRHIARTGAVGVIENGPGPVVLVRTDIDALPVVERTGLPFASKARATNPQGQDVGVMHACGHDVHMTCFVGTARWLASHRDRWKGTVVLIAQPAEEAIGGARDVLADGLYTRFPRPNFALALHCQATEPAGHVYYRPGPLLASSTSMTVTIRGKGGHGAWPHRTVDPIVLASLAVLDFQTIVGREVEPIQPAVVTVGSIHGGNKHNVIPDEVKLQLTLRAFSEPVRLQLIEGIERRVKALAEAHRAPAPTVEIDEFAPATINDPDLTARVVPSLESALGAEHVHATDPVMGSEDFSRYAEGGVPIMMFWVGTQPADRLAAAKAKGEALPSLHSALFFPDAGPTIAAGIKAMTGAVVGLLPTGGPAKD
ncbi:putative hydrolase YxeP [Aquisphaera giovannonii]|uniref:Putative hydrolase YxeP n=1 Tax=Aquisphaera giovannonii TaxID=406548 RepID=A0A5B9WCB4_9BACT|nr:amidohydrolase [Aquisphaera giovannonii]QEH38256.1 putative hydrolase YxeP [Aquisphaera giovannonii]